MADPGSWTRRGLLLAGGTVALAACSAGIRPKRATGPAPDVPIVLRTTWTGKADGPLPPTGDEGRPFLLRRAHTTASPTIRDGALVGNLPATALAAVYLLQDLGARVNRIGARFAFVDGDDSGSVGLLGVRASDLSGHCHLAFAPDRWIASVLRDGQVVEITSQRYSAPVPRDGRQVTADVRFSGATAWITAPDGSVSTVTDRRFRSPSGTVACWEFFKETPRGAAVRFYETWAG
jgi:hypothetical protein